LVITGSWRKSSLCRLLPISHERFRVRRISYEFGADIGGRTRQDVVGRVRMRLKVLLEIVHASHISLCAESLAEGALRDLPASDTLEIASDFHETVRRKSESRNGLPQLLKNLCRFTRAQ